jgi:small conductance mechanosensitive channel
MLGMPERPKGATKKNRTLFSSRFNSPGVGLAVLFLAAGLVFAQQAETPVPKTVTDEVRAELDLLSDRIIEQHKQIADVERRVNRAQGATRRVLETRLDQAWLRLLKAGVAFAQTVADREEAGYDIAVYHQDAIAVLTAQSDVAKTALNRTLSRMTVPEPDVSAAEQAAAYHKVANAITLTDEIYELLITGLALAERFELDIGADEALLEEALAERAINTSVYLEIAKDDVRAVSASVAVLPDDAELAAKLKVAQDRVAIAAGGLRNVVKLMDEIGLDTSLYAEQVLSTTGEITTDLFDFAVIGNLVSRWGQRIVDLVADDGPTFLLRVLLFVVIVLAFRRLARIVERLIDRGLSASKVELSQLLRRMIISTGSSLILVLGVLIALSQVGITLGPLLAGLGIAGFVIGFALQDTLANFAAGLMILFYRPFDVGDVVEAGGVFGKVNHMSLVNTTILTLDNQTLVVPNNMIWGGVIKNVSAQKVRRVDLMFGIAYTDDIPKAERVLQEIVAADNRVLEDPESTIRLHELGDSSVNFIVRPWVESDDYWDVYWDITRAVKMRFDAEGISIPFPQRDVHLFTHGAE